MSPLSQGLCWSLGIEWYTQRPCEDRAPCRVQSQALHFLFPSPDDAFHVGEQFTPIAWNGLFLSVEVRDHSVLAGCCGDAGKASESPSLKSFLNTRTC